MTDACGECLLHTASGPISEACRITQCLLLARLRTNLAPYTSHKSIINGKFAIPGVSTHSPDPTDNEARWRDDVRGTISVTTAVYPRYGLAVPCPMQAHKHKHTFDYIRFATPAGPQAEYLQVHELHRDWSAILSSSPSAEQPHYFGGKGTYQARFLTETANLCHIDMFGAHMAITGA